jgi:hypothetical protein
MAFCFQQHTNLQVKVTNLEKLSNFHSIPSHSHWNWNWHWQLAHPSQAFYTNEAQPLAFALHFHCSKIFEF